VTTELLSHRLADACERHGIDWREIVGALPLHGLPNLAHELTATALPLIVARRVWGDPFVHVVGYPTCWKVVVGNQSWECRVFYAPTELEALLTAIEAAPVKEIVHA